MKITIGQLREMIRDTIAGSVPDETYDIELFSDPKLDEPSVYVPDWTKKKLRKWAKDMKLSSK